MKNFDLFVDGCVSKWFLDKKIILEKGGLAGVEISNREKGDSAENYVVKKIENLSQNYIAKKSKGSRSPVDVFAVGRRGRYWHVMLIQVKSSKNKDKIYELNQNDIKVLSEFAKYFKKEMNNSNLLSNYKNSSVLFSTGYAGVYTNEKLRRNYLQKTEMFGSFKKNMSSIYDANIEMKISQAHSL